MRLHLLVLISVLLFATACTPPLSRPSLDLVDPDLTFAELLRDPDRHIGCYLLLGGTIASVRIDNGQGSELEVVQMPTDRGGRVTTTSSSAGRFIARDDALRDPAIYHPGRLVTLVGRVEGSRTGRIGERDYRYPVLTVHELHLWRPREHPDAARVRFGIGVGIGIGR